MGTGDAFRHRARFFSSDALELRDRHELTGPQRGAEVLIDQRPAPFARELWLPLVWFLLLKILSYDRTEDSDGDRARQREGCPAGNMDVPASRKVAGVIRHMSGSKPRGAEGE